MQKLVPLFLLIALGSVPAWADGNAAAQTSAQDQQSAQQDADAKKIQVPTIADVRQDNGPTTTLWAVYQMALDNDPQIRSAEAQYLAAKENKPQAWSQYLPQISGSASYTKGNSDSSGVRFFGSASFPSDTSSDTTQKSYGVNLRQTVFNWSTINRIDQAGDQVAEAEAQYRAAKQDLITRVADRYFALLSAQDQLAAAKLNQDAISKQLDQTKQRYDVGLIPITDVQESQAAYDQAVADTIAAKQAVTAARENLRAVTGQYVETPARPTDRLALQQPQPHDPDQWVRKALDQNLSVVAKRFAWRAAQQNVDIQRSGHYPTLDLTANYNKNTTDSNGQDNLTNTDQNGSFTSSDRSVALQLSVPIYSGGGTQSKVRQAAHQASAAHSDLTYTMRQTEEQTRDAYLGIETAISKVKALKQARESSRTALKATEAGYEVGTRTAIDVLTSRKNLLQAQTNYEKARYDYITNLLKLNAAAGMLTPKDVQQVNHWLGE